MDVLRIKTVLGTILARVICFFAGHSRIEKRDFYGFMTNGNPIYVQRYEKCSRCGK